MIRRRTLLATSALGTSLFARAAPRTSRRLLTETTAPDPISREILAGRLERITGGAAGHGRAGQVDTDIFEQNYLQLIEQNFAERDAAGVADLMNALTEAELSDLAQLYVTAASDSGKPERLLYVLANRLNEWHLSRLSRHFGFGRVHDAVYAISPKKVQGFLLRADANEYGPVPGEYRFGPQGRFAPEAAGGMVKMAYRQPSGRMMKVLNFTPFLNKNPVQIYQTFRTAQYGSLGVAGALMEAASVLSTGLGSAYTTGYAIGIYVVQPLVETYAPGFYEGLGNWIGGVVETMSNAWDASPSVVASAQFAAAAQFGPTSAQISGFTSTGGDFGVLSGMTGGGGSCTGCGGYFFDPE